jgi:hypothetical protein
MYPYGIIVANHVPRDPPSDSSPGPLPPGLSPLALDDLDPPIAGRVRAQRLSEELLRGLSVGGGLDGGGLGRERGGEGGGWDGEEEEDGAAPRMTVRKRTTLL